MKGQSEIMEHLLLIFFIVVIIVVIIIFITTFQFSQIQLESTKNNRDKALSMAKIFMNSRYFVRNNKIFDDGKLTAISSFYNCKEFDDIFGTGWFIEINVLDGTNVNMDCTWSTYPNCNHWMLKTCGDPVLRNISYVLPINVYRASLEQNQIGIMKAGVYVQ